MSHRAKIVNALVSAFNSNLNGATYRTNVYNKAENKLKFWDEVNQYPYLSVTAGQEYREYLPANQKWGFLIVTIRIYVRPTIGKAQDHLEQALEDIESLLDANNNIIYDTTSPQKETEEISILSITTDEGLLDPLGVGEIQIQIRYDL